MRSSLAAFDHVVHERYEEERTQHITLPHTHRGMGGRVTAWSGSEVAAKRAAMLLAVLRVLLAASLAVSSAGADDGCGGVLTSRAGTIQTPGFPRPFDVPVSCRWVVDSSSVPEETTIVVYLTQLFVTSGLRFTEYTYYEPESSFQLNPRLIYEVTEDDVITTKWVLTRTRYFVIEFNLERLEGNHLRVLDDLLDVYGFNITYEMRTEPSTSAASPELRNDSCSVLTCSLAGNCYVSEDYS
ncbi:hypothetical protein GE061_017662 [Apolygus lucorum]|uniref:CUB domain-containing protein n=1 Tax=Apolygus lucorum TaxID=248454 RepID=A0A8S9XCY8_APOLU|nr:hypothetical protein GE061_017662 [Apolygus lucorum]